MKSTGLHRLAGFALAVLIGVCIAAVLIGVIAGGWIRDEARSRRYERSLGGRP